MKTETSTKPFDPTTARSLSILPVQNGWVIYQGPEESFCSPTPKFVFTSATELGNAVANLVQFGCVEKPVEVELPWIDYQYFKLPEKPDDAFGRRSDGLKPTGGALSLFRPGALPASLTRIE